MVSVCYYIVTPTVAGLYWLHGTCTHILCILLRASGDINFWFSLAFSVSIDSVPLRPTRNKLYYDVSYKS